MPTVIVVDAVPGYEDSVEAELAEMDPVRSTARIKSGNFDIALLLSIEDPAELKRFETNDLRMLSGLSAFKVLNNPSEKLLERLDA